MEDLSMQARSRSDMSGQHEMKSHDVQTRLTATTDGLVDGRLPLSEFAFALAGASSPFGDDLSLPLPPSELTYVHPDEHAAPQHL
jgi:hypothetical protein